MHLVGWSKAQREGPLKASKRNIWTIDLVKTVDIEHAFDAIFFAMIFVTFFLGESTEKNPDPV